MSSLPEKSQPLTAAIKTSIVSSSSLSSKSTTKTFFLRSDSIKKIKCSAVYPFQVAGLKLSKNALIELLETNIIKARICTQRAMLNLYYVILKLLSTLFALWDNKVQIKASVQTVGSESSASIKTNDPKPLTTQDSFNQTFQSRLAEKIIKIQKHKNRLSSDNLIPSVSSVPDTFYSVPSSSSSSQNDLTCSSTSSSTENLRKFSSRHSSKTNLYQSKFQEYCFVVFVHTGVFVMYLQVVILGIALNGATIPKGLAFLLVTIGIIGYIFIKVSLKTKNAAAARSPKSSPLPEAKNIHDRRDPIKDDFSPERQSRSKAKRLTKALELQYKTLSKIKLL